MFRLTGTPVTSVVMKIAPDTSGGAASPVATETARTTAIDPAVARRQTCVDSTTSCCDLLVALLAPPPKRRPSYVGARSPCRGWAVQERTSLSARGRRRPVGMLGTPCG